MENLITRSIIGKLILLFLLAALTPISIVGILSYTTAKRELENEIFNKLTVARDAGKRVEVEFGASVVRTDEDRPLCWYNYDCSLTGDGTALIPSVRIQGHEGVSEPMAPRERRAGRKRTGPGFSQRG